MDSQDETTAVVYYPGFPCKYCKWAFTSLHGLLDHVSSVHMETFNNPIEAQKELATSFNCLHCNAPFNSQDDLDAHLDPYKRIHFCNGNTMMFPCPAKLQKHLTDCHTVLDEISQPDTPEVLEESTNSTDNEMQDLAPGSKRYKSMKTCRYCNKQFPSSYLQNHINSHTGERPYSCSYCDKTYGHKTLFRRHVMNVHPQEYGVNGLKAQAGVSTRKKKCYPTAYQYKCHYCEVRKVRSDHLRSHVALKHCDTLPFKCAKCGEGYEFVRQLIKHAKDQHPGFDCLASIKSWVR